MKRMIKYSILVLPLMLASCYDGVDETVESAFQWPIPPAPEYKFSRNEESSVDLHECTLIRSSLDHIYDRYMSKAYMAKGDYEEAIDIFRNGLNGSAPQQHVAMSVSHRKDRSKILADFQQWFDTSARIAGRGQERPSIVRNTEASQGHTGYVGRNTGDKDLYFVDEKGFAPAEIFAYAVKGAVYLDKIFNVNIHPDTLHDETLIEDNKATRLVKGHNYTALEHHWDLAYGYNDFLSPLAEYDESHSMRGTKEKLLQCYVMGRRYMDTPYHEQVELYADTIRTETARMFAARTINLLTGPNTYANIHDNVKYAFRRLSQAYGMIYSLQFLTDRKGQTLMTYEETQHILHSLEQGHGLWDKERLLANETQEGSLKYIAAFIRERFGLPTDKSKN